MPPKLFTVELPEVYRFSGGRTIGTTTWRYSEVTRRGAKLATGNSLDKGLAARYSGDCKERNVLLGRANSPSLRFGQAKSHRQLD